MISKNKLKFIKSLQIKKYRNEEQSFIIEGAKNVLELLHSDFKIKTLICTKSFASVEKENLKNSDIEIIEATESELEALGTFKTNQAVLAVAEMKPYTPFVFPENEFVLALDDVRDPGNLGTIIRIADWFGIKHLLCSENTADVYNPKVINSSMGSFTRVRWYYEDLVKVLGACKATKFGAFMNGRDVHSANFGKQGIIIMGNESNGISSAVESLINEKITIPGYGNAESLNVAVATAIVCDNLKRISG